MCKLCNKWGGDGWIKIFGIWFKCVCNENK